MTNALDEAVSAAAKLPAEEQEALAALLMEEIASEQRWARSFARSPGLLESLASEALDDFKNGRTEPLDDLL